MAEMNREFRINSALVTGVMAVSTMAASVTMAMAADTDTLQQIGDAGAVVEYAFYAEDTNALGQMRDEFERLATRSDTAYLARYYAALTDYRLGLLRHRADQKRVGRYLDSCVDGLADVLDEKPEFAEAHALRSGCFTAQAWNQPVKSALYKWQAERNIEKALELDPENPRAVLLDSLREFGGGGEEMAGLMRATELFALHEIPRAGWPEWGQAETWAYLGEVYLEQGNILEARNALEEALVLAPDYVRAKQLLGRVAAAQR